MKKTVFLVSTQIKNFIQTYNNQLKNAYKNIADDDTENNYLVLINEDLKANLKDDKKFIDDYIALAEEFKLPYTFFPYYGSFNKAMIKCSHGIPHPVFELTMESKNNMVIDLIHQIAPGCLILNLNMLKKIDFKFDTKYPTVFYLQDLVEKCYRAKLWISNCWYLDRHNSWEDLKTVDLNTKFPVNVKNFQDEQKKYFEEHKDCKFKEPNQFIEDIKKWVKGEDIPVETNVIQNVTVQDNNSNINLTVPSELTKDKNGSSVIKINSMDLIKNLKKEQNKNNSNTNNALTANQKIQQLAKIAQMEEEGIE